MTPRVHMCLLSLLYFFCKITPRCMLLSFVKVLFWWHSTDTQKLPWSFSHTWNAYATKYNLAWEYWASCNLIPCGGFLTCFNVLCSPYGVYYLYMSPSVFQVITFCQRFLCSAGCYTKTMMTWLRMFSSSSKLHTHI